MVTKTNSLDVLPHLECVWHRSLSFCYSYSDSAVVSKQFGWDRPKTSIESRSAQNNKENTLGMLLTSPHDQIDSEMFDKAVNHQRSADRGAARGDPLEVRLHRALF